MESGFVLSCRLHLLCRLPTHCSSKQGAGDSNSAAKFHALNSSLTALPWKPGDDHHCWRPVPLRCTGRNHLACCNWSFARIKHDFRALRSYGDVKLVDAFVRRQHPLLCFNNVLTLTLWALPVAQQESIQLKVGTKMELLHLHVLSGCATTRSLHHAEVPALACLCSVCSFLPATPSSLCPWQQREPANRIGTNQYPEGQPLEGSNLFTVAKHVLQDCLPVVTIPIQDPREGAC